MNPVAFSGGRGADFRLALPVQALHVFAAEREPADGIGLRRVLDREFEDLLRRRAGGHLDVARHDAVDLVVVGRRSVVLIGHAAEGDEGVAGLGQPGRAADEGRKILAVAPCIERPALRHRPVRTHERTGEPSVAFHPSQVAS